MLVWNCRSATQTGSVGRSTPTAPATSRSTGLPPPGAVPQPATSSSRPRSPSLSTSANSPKKSWQRCRPDAVPLDAFVRRKSAPSRVRDTIMATVIAGMSMSLDGFIAGPNDEVEHLFAWYGAGDVEVQTRRDDLGFRTDEQSAELLRDILSSVGAHICGRRQYEVAGAWGGSHPLGVPVFVVT